MDTGEGKFEEFEKLTALSALREEYPKSKGVFTVGEVLEIKGSRFEVRDISTYGMKLKLLPALDVGEGFGEGDPFEKLA